MAKKLEGAQGPKQFGSHLYTVVFRNDSLRRDVRNRTDRLVFEMQHFSLQEPFFSASLAEDLGQGQLDWWLVFADHLAQRLNSLDHATEQEEALLCIIDTNQWNLNNFKRILGISTDGTTPPSYPAQASDIPDLPSFMAYQEKVLIRAMKDCAMAAFGWDETTLEKRLEQTAIFERLRLQRDKGVRMFLPTEDHPAPGDFRLLGLA